MFANNSDAIILHESSHFERIATVGDTLSADSRIIRLCTFILLLFFSSAGHFALGGPITPSANWLYEVINPPITFSSIDPATGLIGEFATGDAACEYAEPLDHYIGGGKYEYYLDTSYTVDPNAGPGCMLHYQIYSGSILIDDSIAYQQHMALPQGRCPSNEWVAINGKCERPRPPKDLCCQKGDPVSPGSGAGFQEEVDYSSRNTGGNINLTFARQYSSSRPLSNLIPYGNGPLGYSWFIKKYGRFLKFDSSGANQYVYAVRAMGDVQIFELQGSVWVGDNYNNDGLVQLSLSEAPAAWEYTNAEDNSVERYDAAGKLLTITTRTGLVYSLQYSDSNTPPAIALTPGLLISVTDPFGRSLHFTYNSAGYLVTMTDPAGQLYNYAYDENLGSVTVNGPVLTSVTYPDGKKRSYLYELQLAPQALDNLQSLILFIQNYPGVSYPNMTGVLTGPAVHVSDPSQHVSNTVPDPSLRSLLGEKAAVPLTGIIDENGNRFATISYDAKGRAISTQHAGGAETTTFTYNADGTTDVTDALGTTRQHGFQTVLGQRKDSTVTQPCADCAGTKTATSTYDANGNLATKTDFKGIETTYAYDLTRNLEISRAEAYGTPQARTITTQWHPTFRLPTVVTEPGRTTSYTYDSVGNLTQKTATDTTISASRTWNYTYNALGMVTSVDGPRTDVSDVTTYDYDAQGNLTTITNALNQVTHITSYDANGRSLTIVDPNGLTTTLTYAPRGWLTSRTVSDGATAETTTYDYDGVGQLTRVTLPDNSYISYTYDAAHRLTGIADSLGNHISYTLDAMGNRTEEDVYDPSNTLTQTRSHVYTALNHLAQDIGAQNQITDYSYDNNGNLTGTTDPLGHTTSNGYDALNRLVQVTDPASGVTHYGYDAQDHLTSVTDPRNLQTTYDYDALDDLGRQVSPDTGTTTNTYDAAGNLLTATGARGAVTTYTYDALNRVTQISATLGGSTATTAYEYDTGPYAVGKLGSISDADSTTTYAYDSFGRLSTKTQVTGAVSLTVAYAYDGAGRLSQITYPSGKVVSYSYDTQGRIAALDVGAQTLLDTLNYSPFGVATGWTWGNGSTYSRPLDSDGRVASFTLNGQSRTVTYDAANRITSLTDALSQGFGYDNLDRLVSYTSSTVNQTFAYDAVGNRTQFGDSANSDNYTYAAASNRLMSITGSHARTYSYASNGNITGDGTHSYSYDPRNRLVDVDNDTTYTLNGLGQRIEKNNGAQTYAPGDANGDGAFTVADIAAIIRQILGIAVAAGNPDCNLDGNVSIRDLVCVYYKIVGGAAPISGGKTFFAYDEQGRIIGEYNSNGEAIEETVYFGSQPVAVLKQSNVYYIHTDQLNTPRVITDSTNTAVWRWDSDPFGTTVANDDPDMDGVRFTYNLRFPGQYYDQETKLNYNYFRDYDPGTGRYIESDPIGMLGGLNTYVYAILNPVKYSDSTGLDGSLDPEPPKPGPAKEPYFPANPACSVVGCSPSHYLYLSDFSGDQRCVAKCFDEANQTVDIFSPIPFIEDPSTMRSIAAWSQGLQELIECAKKCALYQVSCNAAQ